MQQINIRPLKHILVCTNERDDGRDFCAKVDGIEIYRNLKEWIKSNGLSSSVWVTRTGCLGFCNEEGTTVVIYPDKRWFYKVRKENIEEIKQMLVE